MSFVHGKSTDVYLGGREISSWLTAFDMSLDVDAADTTTFGSGWKTAIPGTSAATCSFSGLHDVAGDLNTSLLLSLVPGVLTYMPSGGATIGDPARIANVIDVSFATSSPVGGVVAVTGSLQTDGIVGFGNVLHPFAYDTDTTVGASRNDGAATATGWTAALHVIFVDTPSSWVVKLEDSANNTDWADVTGGAFAAKTAFGAEILHSAAADTALRRYVRYTATRTGGDSADRIRFLLSYARN